MKSKIYLAEDCFLTIQGEGALIGKPTVFVRTGGCDFRCQWCDSLYAVLPQHRKEWELLEAEEIFARVQKLSPSPILITLSGGNPALEPLEKLIDLGQEQGYTYAIETQGTVVRSWFAKLDHLTLSPKGPSSGMKIDWKKLERCIETSTFSRNCRITLKIVVFDELDYLFAREVAKLFPTIPLYLQTGNSHVKDTFSLKQIVDRTKWLIERAAQDQWNTVTILPQLHTILWANKRGV